MTKSEVACISFGFDNREVIQLLKKRGKAIYNGKLDESIKYLTKLETLVDDEKMYNKITRPVTAFVMFNHLEHREIFLE